MATKRIGSLFHNRFLFATKMAPVKQIPPDVEVGTKASIEDDKTIDSFDQKHVVIHQKSHQRRSWSLAVASAIFLVVVAIAIVVAVLLGNRKMHASTSMRSSKNAYVANLGTNSSDFQHNGDGMMGHHGGGGDGPPGHHDGDTRDDCSNSSNTFSFRNHSDWFHENDGNHTEWGNHSDSFDEHNDGRSNSSADGHPW